ncbi:hypothetical protein MOBT1_002499 [Malassezia obtusa]|uniref:Rpr2-domain-containing protein n=1 Tax=Malassezia obtusa TaxID=76774 RepID=A0AAF0E2G1_9BASI|nr:hypothetical protein MOBT1_002499 [Malassezia obtusa]
MAAKEESANTARALLRDQHARNIAAASPSLASRYERDFAHAVRTLLRHGMDASLAPSRAVLWAPGAAPASRKRRTNIAEDLPTWYAQANPVCEQCAVPLIPGLTAHHRAHRARGVRLVYECDACGTAQRVPKYEKKALPSVRSRRKTRKQILAGKGTEAAGPEGVKKERDGPTTGDGAPMRESEAPKSGREAPKKGPDVAKKKLHAPQNGVEARRPATVQPGPLPGAPRRPGPAPGAPAASARKPKKGAFDAQDGLRALLQQKKSEPSKPKGGGLADFLSQL